MDDLRLFGDAASHAASSQAQERVDAAALPSWKDEADAAIRRTARLFPAFAVDDVWQYGDLPRTRENRALGPRMTAAWKAGVIAPTNEYRPSRVIKHHATPRRVWRSLIFKGEV